MLSPQQLKRSASVGDSERPAKRLKSDSNVESNILSESSTVQSQDKRRRRKKKKRKLAVTAAMPTRVAQQAAPSKSSTPEPSDTSSIAEELQAKTLLLSKYQKVLDHFQASLCCQICLSLLQLPYALVPCGHVACHSCLVQWFTSLDERTPRPPNFYSRKKTCPHCRTVVRVPPVEVWEIKGMANELVNSNLFPNLPQNASSSPALPEDPWKNIFRKPFAPLPDIARDDIPIEEIGMLDAEDGGIYRCLDCMHEIWPDGICSGCQRRYPAHLALAHDVDSDAMSGGRVVLFAEFTDDEDEGYENSFIDDESDRDATPLPLAPIPLLLSGDDDSDSELDERQILFHPRLSPLSSNSRDSEQELSDDSTHIDSDDDEEEEEIDVGDAPTYRPTRFRNAFTIDDSEDESGDD